MIFFKFSWHSLIFSIPSSGMAIFYSNYKITFFQFYPFPSGEPIFSKFKNKNFPFKFKNDFFKIFSFQIFLVA
jgi:hypothetical protein